MDNKTFYVGNPPHNTNIEFTKGNFIGRYNNTYFHLLRISKCHEYFIIKINLNEVLSILDYSNRPDTTIHFILNKSSKELFKTSMGVTEKLNKSRTNDTIVECMNIVKDMFWGLVQALEPEDFKKLFGEVVKSVANKSSMVAKEKLQGQLQDLLGIF